MIERGGVVLQPRTRRVLTPRIPHLRVHSSPLTGLPIGADRGVGSARHR